MLEYRRQQALPVTRIRPTLAPRHGLARVLSKMGMCSRSQAEVWIREGRVRVDGQIVRDPYRPTPLGRAIVVDGQVAESADLVYIAFNKPRGLLVSTADERGRETVYQSLADAGLPWLGAVGRLDKASEGLLLFSNDTGWAAGITEPKRHLEKTYHVQVAGHPQASILAVMREGVVDDGQLLRVSCITVLRAGEKNTWLEIVLDEGRNRHIRRLLATQGFDVLRLIRVAIGVLPLGDLPKGLWRRLDPTEVKSLDTRSP